MLLITETTDVSESFELRDLHPELLRRRYQVEKRWSWALTIDEFLSYHDEEFRNNPPCWYPWAKSPKEKQS